MPYCAYCGTQVESSYNFCSACGSAVAEGGPVATAQQVPGEIQQPLGHLVTVRRVLLMTVLSYGLYLFYWFYLTWKHYRDHTRSDSYPVWHTLTLLVPIYGLFRTHAHMRSYKELMLNAGLVTTISAGWAVVLVLIAAILDNLSLNMAGGITNFGGISQRVAVATAFIDVVSILIVAGLLTHVQGNINRYWLSLGNVRLAASRIGVGEVIFALVGLAAWFDTLASLLSASYRRGF